MSICVGHQHLFKKTLNMSTMRLSVICSFTCTCVSASSLSIKLDRFIHIHVSLCYFSLSAGSRVLQLN